MIKDIPTNLHEAFNFLQARGKVETNTPHCYPSYLETTAFDILKEHESPDWFMSENGTAILLTPKIGMGATLHYPSDCYPYEVTKVISNKTIEVREMDAIPDPNWKADFTPGGFCGHIHNLRDQKFTYKQNLDNKPVRIRLNKHGQWMSPRKIPFTVGYAKFFRDWND